MIEVEYPWVAEHRSSQPTHQFVFSTFQLSHLPCMMVFMDTLEGQHAWLYHLKKPPHPSMYILEAQKSFSLHISSDDKRDGIVFIQPDWNDVWKSLLKAEHVGLFTPNSDDVYKNVQGGKPIVLEDLKSIDCFLHAQVPVHHAS